MDREELLSKLISFRTVNPTENEWQLCLALKEILEPMGFRCTLQQFQEKRGNIIAEIGACDAPVSLMLTGHLDVVGVDDGWTVAPFELTEQNGRYYGRGTCDMKGAISAMILAADEILRSERQFQNRLILGFVGDEEISGEGTRFMLESGIRADYVVIGEPTMMDICIAHRGVDRYRVTINGRAGHASEPQNSRNPLYFAAKLLTIIEEHQQRLSALTHPVLPAPSIAATIFQGGVQGNAIPQSCELIIDRRTVPGETQEFVSEELNGLLAPLLKAHPEYSVETKKLAWLPPCSHDENARLPQTSRRLLQDMGINACIKDFPAGCDLCHFVQAGLDAVLIGPGSIEQAHTADEFVEIDQLDKAQVFYQKLIEEFLF